MALGRKTGGRKKGSRNKRLRELAAHIEASGLAPLAYMLKVLRDETQPKKRRDEMARAAAPYVHCLIDSKLTFLRRLGKSVLFEIAKR